jgi:hypothetical protein
MKYLRIGVMVHDFGVIGWVKLAIQNKVTQGAACVTAPCVRGARRSRSCWISLDKLGIQDREEDQNSPSNSAPNYLGRDQQLARWTLIPNNTSCILWMV